MNILPNLKQITSTTLANTTTATTTTPIPQTRTAPLSEPSITTNGNTMPSSYLQMSSFPVVHAVAPAVAQVLPGKIALPKAINTAPTKAHQPIHPQSLQYAIAPLNSTPTLQVFNSPVSLVPAAAVPKAANAVVHHGATSGEAFQLLTLSNKPNILNMVQKVIPSQLQTLPINNIQVSTPTVSMGSVTTCMTCPRTSESTESTQQNLVPPSSVTSFGNISTTSVLPSITETLSTTVPLNIPSFPVPLTNITTASTFVSSEGPTCITNAFPNSGIVQPTQSHAQLSTQVIPTGSISIASTAISSVQSYTSSQVSYGAANVSRSSNTLNTKETSCGFTLSTSREHEAIAQQNVLVGNSNYYYLNWTIL